MSLTRSSRFRAAIGVSTTLMFLAACGGDTTDSASGEGSTKLVELSVAPPSASLVAHGWWYLAEDFGFYEEEGLKVDVVGQVASESIGVAVAEGQLDAGAESPSQFLPSFAKQPDNPNRCVATVGMWPFSVMVPEDSPITKASDLVGKTVGVPDASDESRLAYMLQVADVDSTKVKALPIGGRAPAAIEMRAGRVDAFMGSYVDRMAIRTQGGLPVRDIETVPAEGTFNNCIMVRQDDLADDERRGELVGLMRALAKAATVQFEDPELAIKVLGENHPEAYENADDALALMRAAAEVERPAYDNKWASTPDKWQEFLDTFIEEGSVDKAYDVGPYIDGSLLDEIWDFDKDEVLEQARAQQ